MLIEIIALVWLQAATIAVVGSAYRAWRLRDSRIRRRRRRRRLQAYSRPGLR